ncbi:TonB-dependent receptor [Sphingomonas sp.]|uniref:TonB-dependent siderophore receptor n=1 Tax=Sphingomonas sp. TaxID=28214 RepID=UPI0031E03BB8
MMLSIAAGSMIAAPPVQAQTAAAPRNFDIAPQALADAMIAFAAQSGYQVTTDAAMLRGVRSDGVRGTYTSPEALSRLLTGTGFTFRINGKLVTLEPAPQVSGGAIQLGPVRVEGETGTGTGGAFNAVNAMWRDPGRTEGTRSYTSSATGTAAMPLTLRETPQSVSIVTRQQITDLNLLTLNEVLMQTPGIVVDRTDERVYFTSRGFDLSPMIDGVPTLAFQSVAGEASMISTVIYDRVEVLRGAAGLLNGVGSPGGSINLIRKRPGNIVAGYLNVGVGSWNRYLIEGDIGGPVAANGAVRVRVAGQHRDGASFIENKRQREDVVYGIVEADLTSSTIVSIGGQYQQTAIIGANFGQNPLFYNDGRRIVIPRSYNLSAPWSYWDMTTKRAFATLEHRFENGWQVKADAGYVRNERERASADVSVYPSNIDAADNQSLITLFGNPAYSTGKSFDIRASGPLHLFGADDHLVIGANVNRYNDGLLRLSSLVGGEEGIYFLPGFYDVIPRHNIFDMRSIAWRDFRFPITPSRGRTAETALYGSLRVKPVAPLSILLGGRVTRYRNESWDGSPGADGVLKYELSGSVKEDGIFTPYVGTVVDISSQISAYASYTSIFQPNVERDRNNRVIAPRRGNNFEIGLKGEHFGGRLNTSIALFRIVEDNLPVLDEFGELLPNGSQPYHAIKGARSRGVELTVAGEVTSGWQISAGYTFTEKRDQQNELLNTQYPKHIFRANTNYSLPGTLSPISLGGSFRYQSGIYFDEIYGLGRVRQGGMALVDINATYRIDDRWSASVNIDNITDKSYYSGLGGYNGFTYGDPRNAWLRLRYRF